MIRPEGEKRTAETTTSSNPTRVQKGKHTIDMRPKPTPSILSTGSVFFNSLKHYPSTIAAQFAVFPSNFEGIIEENAAEIKRLSKNPHLRNVHIETESPEAPS